MRDEDLERELARALDSIVAHPPAPAYARSAAPPGWRRPLAVAALAAIFLTAFTATAQLRPQVRLRMTSVAHQLMPAVVPAPAAASPASGPADSQGDAASMPAPRSLPTLTGSTPGGATTAESRHGGGHGSPAASPGPDHGKPRGVPSNPPGWAPGNASPAAGGVPPASGEEG